MLIGVPKEIKIEEYRVGLTPYSVRELVNHNHTVLVQSGAGLAINFSDNDYYSAGAKVVPTIEDVYAEADMIVKVKEPQDQEYPLIRGGQILFTYLHLAPDIKLTNALLESGCIGIAYETVTGPQGSLPLLSPMSQVAGRLAVQAGAHCLEKSKGGSGVLLGGVPGVCPGKVTVIGGGVVGTNAVRMAMGKEAQVTVLDKSLHRLQMLDLQFGGRLTTAFSTEGSIEHYVTEADLVIGAVLLPGKAAPKLLSKNIMKKMQSGSVVVDVAIDQGGCFETSRPTTHKEPTYVVDGVVHYCVANMPGAVPRTSTMALNNATLPFVVALADKGYRQAMLDDQNLLRGLNVYRGQLTYEGVALDQGKTYVPAADALKTTNDTIT